MPLRRAAGHRSRALPNSTAIALPDNPRDQPAVFGLGQLRGLAPQFGLSVVERQVTSRDELATDVRGVASRGDAVILAADNLLMENPELVVTSALSEGKPVLRM